jgi:hypothetical protein
MLMDREQEFEKILRKGNAEDMILFLRTLTDAERKALVPQIKKSGKYYLTYEMVGNTFKNKATPEQGNALGYAWFFCYSKKEFEKENPAWLISKEHLDKLLPWYAPDWLSDYVNSFASREWLPYALNYIYLMELKNKSFLQPHPQIIARLLINTIYEHADRSFQFNPEKLLLYSETLSEHIWYLFQFETTLYFANRYMAMAGQKSKDETDWVTVFKKYAAEGKIDRLRLMKETLLASNRNFNKNLSGWFAELFLQLEPAVDEMISVQPELLVVLSSPHSKVVNVGLQSFKVIADHPSFAVDDFLDAASSVITSETKSVVTACLQVLEKISRKYKDKRKQIVELVTPVFIQKDEALQSKTAKLIQKFGDRNDEELKAVLNSYLPTLFSATKQILNDFLETIMEEEQSLVEISTEKNYALTDDKKLPSINSFDDLVFLCSSAFDNNETWHIDLLPAALLQRNDEVRGSNIAKLEPALQRALKLYHRDWRSTNGYLDQLLACFFIDYCFRLIDKHGADAAPLKRHCEQFFSKYDSLKQHWQQHGTNITYIGGWKANSEDDCYRTHKTFLVYALQCIMSAQKQPFLSTPTHVPGWIDPVTLVQRVISYDGTNVIPNAIDIQIAFSRCWLHNTEEAIALARQNLSGETLNVLLFLLDPSCEPSGKLQPEWLWTIASLSKSPLTVYPALQHFHYSQHPAKYTGQYPWKAEVEHYLTDKYQWEDGKMKIEKVPAQRKTLSIDFSERSKESEKTGLKKWLNKLIPSKEEKTEQTPLIYDHMEIRATYVSAESNDIRRLLMLIPNNPEPLLAQVLHSCFRFAEYLNEGEKRLLVEALKAVHDIWKPFGETAHVLIAISMLAPDKTACSYAAEIWIKGVYEQSINSNLIGSAIAKMQTIELAPLKRFTDTVMDRMLGISALHNRALEELLVALLKGLPETPVKNLKKTLEIYFELVNTNRSGVKDKDLEKILKIWKEKENLKKVVKLA